MPGRSSLNSPLTEVTVMKQTESFWISAFIILGLLFIFCAVISMHIYTYRSRFEDGYKAACIDFYKGNIKMELKEQPNGELLWVKKGELK